MATYQSAYTGAQIDAAIQKVNNLFNLVYPVGSIYVSVNSTSPATLFGGTWEQIQGKFLLGGSSLYPYGNTGGEATTILTEAQMPPHYHAFWRQQWYSADQVANSSTGSIYSWKSTSGGTSSAAYTVSTTASDGHKGVTGGGQAHNNMPPYLSVYMWKRTA